MDKNIDWKEVENLKGFFSFFTSDFLRKKPCRVRPEKVIEWIKENQKAVIVDIRTSEETSLVGFTYEGSLKIPMNQLFERENIETLKDYENRGYKIVVACRSDVRSLVATAFLQRVGFRNVHSLEGGIIAFAEAVKC